MINGRAEGIGFVRFLAPSVLFYSLVSNRLSKFLHEKESLLKEHLMVLRVLELNTG